MKKVFIFLMLATLGFGQRDYNVTIARFLGHVSINDTLWIKDSGGADTTDIFDDGTNFQIMSDNPMIFDVPGAGATAASFTNSGAGALTLTVDVLDALGAFTAGSVTSDVDVTATGDLISGDDVILPATGKLSLDGASPTTYWIESTDDEANLFVGAVEAMTIVEDTEIIIGIKNASPEDWDVATPISGFQIGATASFMSYNNNQAFMGNNAYFDDTDNRWEYITSSQAARIHINDNGLILFEVSNEDGTADNAITFVTALSIENDGDLKSQDYYLLEGYATGRNVLRSITFIATGSANANTCTFELSTTHNFNGEALAAETVTEGTPGARFSLDAAGDTITLTGMAKTVQKMLASSPRYNTTNVAATAITDVVGNDLVINIYQIDGTQLVFSDIVNTKVLQFDIIYATSD